MHVLGIDRVLIATPDLEAATDRFAELLGVEFGARLSPGTLENATSPTGVEFVTDDDPDSPVGGFLDRRGPGLYAVAFEVADLDAAREELEAKGVDPIDEMRVRDFRELFYHPRDFGGVLVVLTAYDLPHRAEIAARGVREDSDLL